MRSDTPQAREQRREERRVREVAAKDYTAECSAALPPDFVGLCNEGRKSGLSMEATLAQIQAAAAEQGIDIAAMQAAQAAPIPAPPRAPRRILVYGALAAAGIGAYLLLRKRR